MVATVHLSTIRINSTKGQKVEVRIVTVIINLVIAVTNNVVALNIVIRPRLVIMRRVIDKIVLDQIDRVVLQ